MMDVGDREILLTHEFDTLPDLVFDAWANPEKIGKWWGPNGFTTTTHFMVKVKFENLHDKTRLIHRMIFPSKKARDNTVEFGALEGRKQILNRLAGYLKLA